MRKAIDLLLTQSDEKRFLQCGVLLPKSKLQSLPLQFANVLNLIMRTFGGYWIEGEADGRWLDGATGIEHIDRHMVIAISVPDQEGLRTLKKIVAGAAKELKELCLYMSIVGGGAFFVWAVL